jgi:hypothetical protein
VALLLLVCQLRRSHDANRTPCHPHLRDRRARRVACVCAARPPNDAAFDGADRAGADDARKPANNDFDAHDDDDNARQIARDDANADDDGSRQLARELADAVDLPEANLDDYRFVASFAAPHHHDHDIVDFADRHHDHYRDEHDDRHQYDD